MTSPASPQVDGLDAFRQDQTYLGADHRRNERRTWAVTAICAVTLVGLVAGGLAFGSMALLANGLHMAAHVAALLVSAGAYALARRHATDPRFAFGTGKLGYLAGFANAVVLAVTAVLIATESLKRLLDPLAVDYHGALPLAAAGLALNLVCVWLLRPTRLHAERNDRDGDLNLSSAYLHLVADAGVSVVALTAMALGQALGWSFLDPAAGLVGAALVAHFSIRLLRRAGAALLDINPSAELTAEVRERLEAGGEAVVDLHLWRLGPGHHAVIAVVAGAGEAQAYRARLAGLPGLSHVTIEVRPAGCGHDHHHGHSH
ncbi:CDF family Co(II)/Ni(II) efflux transporter DmeF [Phenylobacterium sp.]|jgi:cation diffusion facilitator family transporter|uniref:CDF family Co(II)/Ni(II) efflux transporter DmeF n=1 Tax=Phenylobacterium sp. TaxID=1871053 RepID=UPI003783CDFE